MGLYGPGAVPDEGGAVLANLAALLETLVTNLLAGAAPADASVTDAKVAANAAIAQSKIAGLVAALAAAVKLTGDQTIAGLKDFTTAPTVNGSPLGATAPLTLTAPVATAVPLTLQASTPSTTDYFRIVGPDRVIGDPSAGKYRFILDRNMGVATNAAITVSTGVWTDTGQVAPPVLAQGRPYVIGADSDVVGPTLYLKGNGAPASSHVEIQDLNNNKVLEISQPASVANGAWMSIGAEDPIATLTLDDKYEEPAGGATVSFVMRHGRGTGSPASVRFKLPSTGELDISANSEAGENALSEWALRFGHGTQGVSFQTAAAPGGTRTEMGRFVSNGLLLKAPAATSGVQNQVSPTLTFQDQFWTGSATAVRGFRVKDVALGSGPHALQFIVDETSQVCLAIGYTGQVGIGDPFVSNLAVGQLHVVAAATTTPAIVADSAASPTADIQQWRINTTLASRISKGGRFITAIATAPALGDLVNGEMALSTDASGNLIVTSRVGGVLKTATVTVA